MPYFKRLPTALLFAAVAWALLGASCSGENAVPAVPAVNAASSPELIATTPPGEPFVEPVVFADFHDPAVIELNDGRRFGVELPPGQTGYPAWPPGQALRLHYRDDAGAYLEAVGTGLSLRILTWPVDGHPIDLARDRHIEANDTTLGRVEAHDVAARRWQTEVERAYHAWEITPDLSPAARAAIARSARQWHATADAYTAAVAESLATRDGSFWRARTAEELAQLHRDHATRIWSLLHF